MQVDSKPFQTETSARMPWPVFCYFELILLNVECSVNDIISQSFGLRAGHKFTFMMCVDPKTINKLL